MYLVFTGLVTIYKLGSRWMNFCTGAQIVESRGDDKPHVASSPVSDRASRLCVIVWCLFNTGEKVMKMR